MIQKAGARLWYLPPYSPDLNPIEQVFAKIKHWMRIAQKRTIDDACDHIGDLVRSVLPGNAAITSSMPDTVPSKDETL
jgi:putative transposase